MHQNAPFPPTKIQNFQREEKSLSRPFPLGRGKHSPWNGVARLHPSRPLVALDRSPIFQNVEMLDLETIMMMFEFT